MDRDQPHHGSAFEYHASSRKTPTRAKLTFGNRKWHYDTRYFDTSVASMKRVVVRVYAGDAKTKGNPMVESVGFTGSALTHSGHLEQRLDRWHHGNQRACAGSAATTTSTGTGTGTGTTTTPVTTPAPTVNPAN